MYDRVLAHPVCTVIGSIFVKMSPDEGEGYITYGRTPTPKIFRVPPLPPDTNPPHPNWYVDGPQTKSQRRR